MREEHANIMLLGRTGAGKSQFINYLLDADVAKTGVGAPITENFDTYDYNDVKSDDTQELPLRIYDSRGLEALDYPAIKQNILSSVKEQCGSEDVYKWIHSIFYCVNVTTSRFEPEEAAFVKKLSDEIAQTVHIILTHCKQTPEGLRQSRDMEERIRSQLGDARTRIYCVNSKDEKTRGGTFPAFGRDEVLQQIVELLWSDICHKVAKSYAKEMYKTIKRFVDELQQVNNAQLKSINICTTFYGCLFSRNTLDASIAHFSSFAPDTKRFAQQIHARYQEALWLLAKFCNQYRITMKQEALCNNPFWEFDWFPHLEFSEKNEITTNSELGQFITEMENYRANAVEANASRSKFIKISIIFLIRFKKYMRDLSNAQLQKIRSKIPDEQAIEDQVYAKLMEAYQG